MGITLQASRGEHTTSGKQKRSMQAQKIRRGALSFRQAAGENKSLMNREWKNPTS